MRTATLLLSIFLLVPATAWAQTGKISGQVTEAASGEPLPGVNVVIEGTTQGTVTDVDGYYDIINLRPGTYDVRASFVGFTPQVHSDVRVSTDLTTTIDFELEEEAVGLDELVVQAQRPIVQRDVSANVANLSTEDFVDLPVAGISEVLDLQAGIEPGLQIRGGGLNEVSFIVDGMNMRTGRNNEPITNVSYTSLEEVQVQTGGFNAEYGNVRAGIVNIATKEPPRNRYSFDGLIRYQPIQDKTFNSLGVLPENCDYSSGSVSAACDAWYVRPALDPEVRLEGSQNTDKWDMYQKRQYLSFEGWNSVVSRLRDKGFDVTADDMIEYFKYTHRKDPSISAPDYDADVTIGGPVPGISNMLGDLRFLASYRGTQTAYLYPQTRESFQDNTFQLKVLSNIRPGMRLTLSGLRTSQEGQNSSAGIPDVQIWNGSLPPYPWWSNTGAQRVGAQVTSQDIRGDEIYTDGQYALADIDHSMIGVTFTHTLNNKTFYEVSANRVASKYRSGMPNLRDDTYICPDSGSGPDGRSCRPGQLMKVPWTDNFGNVIPGFEDKVTCFGSSQDLTGDGNVKPYCVGTEPFGYLGTGGNLETGETTGGHWVKTRDTSDVQVYNANFDLTSQVNRFLQIKTGAELILSDYDMRFAEVNMAIVGPEPVASYPWQRSPIQGAAYLQNKLEFQGMIANLGVRLDYFNANSEWWVFDPYDRSLVGGVDRLDEQLPQESTGSQVAVSPRLGVSFPITEDSKLYFNYGHFRQMLNPSSIFGIQESATGGIDAIGNPRHPMPKTVAYELGYDQNILDQFLFRISGFYRDIKLEPRDVSFNSLGDVVSYQTQRPWNYRDVRGAELSLSKNRGTWVRGFLNFTYLQRKSGSFGYASFFENTFDMVRYLADATDYRQSVPVAEPFARGNIIFMSPNNFGPDVAGFNPLGDWRVSLLGEWRAGTAFTWAGGGSNPDIQDNVSWRDYWNFDLRLAKQFNTVGGSVQIFGDISNVFNIRNLHRNAGFITGANRSDFDDYMRSLHLDKDIFHQIAGESTPYRWVPGSDEPGDFRDPDVAYQPIEAVSELPSEPPSGGGNAWYWTEQTGYSQWNGNSWESVPSSDVDEVLDKKAYIDMPNLRYNTFLNPRMITVGLRVSF